MTDAVPPLAAPPVDAALQDGDAARRAFKALNRWFMVPLTRAGLGQWVSTPIGGYIVLLRVRGRQSGITREVPLNYLVTDGAIWVCAGFGTRTEWYRNLVVDPEVDAWLPGRRVHGRATEVLDPVVRARILPALLRSTGLPALLAGINPWTATPDQVADAMDFVPLIRVDPRTGPLEPGRDDPGGRAWVWRQAMLLGLATAALRALRKVLRAADGSRTGRARAGHGCPCAKTSRPRS